MAETLAVGMELHKAGRLDEARQVYEAILDQIPDHVDALHFLGVLSHQQGRKAAALELLAKAIALDPRHAAVHNNLGNVLREQQKLAEAVAAYHRVLEIDPRHADAYANLGAVLRAQGELDEAVSACRHAIALQPDHAAAHVNLGAALCDQGRFPEAAEAYRKAIQLNPARGQTFEVLGRVLYKSGATREAEDVFREWLKREPANPVARHMLAACSGEDVPSRASDAYLKDTFDGFADSFDENLASLDYRAPELVAAAIGSVFDPAGALDVLDAGCGTGLCGPLLRPHARTLVGVDLSTGMLKKAADRGVYDRLVTGELTAFLADAAAAYHVIVSADTLIYFGDLRPVLTVMSAALRSGGYVAFTLERDPGDASAGFRLNPSGRYSHTEAHVTERLEEAGLRLRSISPCVLRRELGQPVSGLVILARRER